MSFKGWKQREANARASIEERAELRASPEYQERQRQYQALRDEQERAAEEERQRAREAQGAPAREVVTTLAGHVADPVEFVTLARALRRLKPSDFADALDIAIARKAGEARDATRAAEAANIAAVIEAMSPRAREQRAAQSDRARVTRAATAEERRVVQQAAIDARRAELAAEAAQEAEQAA